MATMATPHDTVEAHGHDLSFIRKYVFSTDHKIIGIQFLVMSLLFLLVGGSWPPS